jgi:hypothetical protein
MGKTKNVYWKVDIFHLIIFLTVSLYVCLSACLSIYLHLFVGLGRFLLTEGSARRKATTWIQNGKIQVRSGQVRSVYDWRSVSLSVLVSSPISGSWPDINYVVKVTVLSIGGRPLWREVGSVFCHSQSLSQFSVCTYITKTMYKSWKWFIYNMYKASVSPGSVQHIKPYC